MKRLTRTHWNLFHDAQEILSSQNVITLVLPVWKQELSVSYHGHLSLYSNLPIINFHMLTIKEKNGCWNQRDVKVSCVDWHCIHIHNVYISHTRQVMGGLGQLMCQGTIIHYLIIHNY